jgi:hypothetical protein
MSRRLTFIVRQKKFPNGRPNGKQNMKHRLKSVRTLAATLITFGSLAGGANAAL